MRSLSIARVVALTLCGLCGSARAQRYTFHDYGQSEGLKNLNTRCFLQDTIGFLWVCTEDGLFRFDGSSRAHDNSLPIRICSLSGLFYVNVRDRRLGPQRLATTIGPQGRVYEAVQDAHETMWFTSDSGLGHSSNVPTKPSIKQRHTVETV
jgi:ligand-binding sensor domain-containing protein